MNIHTENIQHTLRLNSKKVLCALTPLLLLLFSACGNINGNFDPSTGQALPPSPFSQGVTIGSYIVMVLMLFVPLFFLRLLLKAQKSKQQNLSEELLEDTKTEEIIRS